MEANRALATQAPEPSGNAPVERLLVFVAHKAEGRWARGCQQSRAVDEIRARLTGLALYPACQGQAGAA